MRSMSWCTVIVFINSGSVTSILSMIHGIVMRVYPLSPPSASAAVVLVAWPMFEVCCLYWMLGVYSCCRNRDIVVPVAPRHGFSHALPFFIVERYSGTKGFVIFCALLQEAGLYVEADGGYRQHSVGKVPRSGSRMSEEGWGSCGTDL